MTSLNVVCPQCGKQYVAPAHFAGRSLRCKACQATILVPQTPAASEDDFWNTDQSNARSGDAEFPRSPLPSQTSGSPPPGSGGFAPTQPSLAGTSQPTYADEIDYEIFGNESQYCEITLDPGETVIAEAGALMYMDQGVEMQTVFGDPSAQNESFWGKALSAGKRALTGESLFMTTFTHRGQGRAKVAFGSPYPGRMLPLHLDQLGGEIILQKDSFLCGAKGIKIGIAFQKKIGVGLFGGEGFIMQRLQGDGIAIAHAGGTMLHRMLAPGEQLRMDTGCLMGMGPSVQYDIQMVGGIKNTFFGGEGLFLATLTGPGPVWMQSLPFSRLAGRIISAAPQTGTNNRGEGSLLGGFGNMLMGDNE